MAGMVERRQRELGIRSALGATPARLVRGVLRETALLVAVGALLGIALALAAGSLLVTLLYGVTPGDPATMVGAVAVLALVGLLAAWLPARRAGQIDPSIALRAE